MSKARKIAALSLLAGTLPALLLAGSAGAGTDEALVPVAQITLPNKINSFDISFVDPLIGSYVFADRTGNAVQLMDTHALTFVRGLGLGTFQGAATCPSGSPAGLNCQGPDGVLILRHKEVWAGDGNSTFKVLDIGSGAVVFSASTGGLGRVDEMCTDGTVVAMTNNSEPVPFTTIWNVRTKTQVGGKIFWDTAHTGVNATNGAEQCQYDPHTGTFYLAIPQIGGTPGANDTGGAVVQFSATGAVLHIYNIPLGNCVGPAGMAVGPAPQILLGCQGSGSQASTAPLNQFTEIMDDGSTSAGANAGNAYAVLANEAGNDMVDFDPSTNHYHLARGNACQHAGCPSTDRGEIGLVDAGVFGSTAPSDDADLDIGLRASSDHSVASDSVVNLVFVPNKGGKNALCSPLGGNDANGCVLVLQAGPDSNEGSE